MGATSEPVLEINAATADDPETLSDWPPSNMKPSRERLVEWLRLFESLGRWDQVEECERYLFAAIPDVLERRDALIQSGDRWWRRKGDLARARIRYREAVLLDRFSERAHARLRSIAHELGQRRVQPFRPTE